MIKHCLSKLGLCGLVIGSCILTNYQKNDLYKVHQFIVDIYRGSPAEPCESAWGTAKFENP